MMPKRRVWGESESLVQISYRVPISLRTKIHKVAVLEDVSTTSLIVELLEKGLSEKLTEMKNGPPMTINGSRS